MSTTPMKLEGFGREVRRRRKALGLTLEELAENSGLTRNYIGSIELGQRDPSLSTIRRLADALDTTVGDLLGSTRKLSTAGFKAALLFTAAPPEVQAAVSEVLRVTSRRASTES